ncbi:hypothetical protein NLG97_g3494 [Lecanicillium saksenae]|uniref:Uncharacterized protein n=1 Tax=Lecanicillium saksenae TaxID=468837 RepID=A0ACC1QY07_9HYPO|nr:hypothetical protein NLG97_g3494 [Lecanicillium saksenae]
MPFEDEASFYERLREYSAALYRYEIAQAVLYFITFLGSILVCSWAFTKLRGPSSGAVPWLKASCVLLTFYCLVQGCSSALDVPVLHFAAQYDAREDAPVYNLQTQQEAVSYLDAIGIWLHGLVKALVFITIVAACAASDRAGRGLRSCLVMSYVFGALAMGLATATFGLLLRRLYLRTHHNTFKDEYDILAAYVYADLALASLLATLAIFATTVSIALVSKSMHIAAKRKSAKLVDLSGLLLMLSTLFKLAWTVRYNWVVPTEFGTPVYLSMLKVILDVWPLLGALALLFRTTPVQFCSIICHSIANTCTFILRQGLYKVKMSYYDDDEPDYVTIFQQESYKIYKYDVAASVLYVLAVLGAAFAFVASSIDTYVKWRNSQGSDDSTENDPADDFDAEISRHPLLDALLYTSNVADFLGGMTQVLIFLTAASFSMFILNAARQTGVSQSSGAAFGGALAYFLAALLIGLKTAVFSLMCYLNYVDWSGMDSTDFTHRILDIARDLQLSFECITTAAAVLAIAFAISARARCRSIAGKDEPALLTVWAGIFLLLSIVYVLAVDVHFTWLPDPFFESPAYYRVILMVLLSTWPMLLAVLILYLALERWGAGAAGNQANHEAEEAVLA